MLNFGRSLAQGSVIVIITVVKWAYSAPRKSVDLEMRPMASELAAGTDKGLTMEGTSRDLQAPALRGDLDLDFQKY